MTSQELAVTRHQCASDDRIQALKETISLAAKLIDAKDTQTSIKINKRLDELDTTWRLENTALPSLISSIHELKSKYRAVCSDTEDITNENRDLRESLKASHKVNKTTLKTLAQLNKENKKMAKRIKRLERKNNEKRSVFQSVKEILPKLQQLETQEKEHVTELKVKMHERFLATDHNSRHVVDDDENDTVISTVSSISTTSLVTDDGRPTVRFGMEEGERVCSSASFASGISKSNDAKRDEKDKRTTTPPPQRRQPNSSYQILAGFLGSASAKVYKVRVASACQVGLQFQKVPRHERTHFSSPSERCGVLNRQIMTDDDRAAATNGEIEKSRRERNSKEGDFVVCGFKGFDDVRHVRPTIGAKLIAINDESLEGNCFSAEEMCDKIADLVAKKKLMAFQFRNDVLNQEQTHILNKGMKGATVMRMGRQGCGFSSDFGKMSGGVDDIFVDADMCIDDGDVVTKSAVFLKEGLCSTMKSAIKLSMAGPRSGFF